MFEELVDHLRLGRVETGGEAQTGPEPQRDGVVSVAFDWLASSERPPPPPLRPLSGVIHTIRG